MLASLLIERPPAADLGALHADLATATRTDRRVAKVLQFYSGRLAAPDRYLLAAVSLFTRPISAQVVLTVAAHRAFGSRLASWTQATVRCAVHGQLAGLASWHPDGTISAHPLVRDTFRSLVMDAAPAAAQAALADMPAARVTSRADALRVVEVIELLLDADQWQPADDMYQARTRNSDVWLHLPAARLGQRAATAFVANPSRRIACTTHLSPRRQGFYLNEVGLFAMNAGDLATARDYLQLAVDQARNDKSTALLAIRLRNLAECLGQLGQTGVARATAAESLIWAETTSDWRSVRNAHALVAWIAGLAGDAVQAERHFTAADRIEVLDDHEGAHLYSLPGILWADWLARTARVGPAHALTGHNLGICREEGWNEDVARCDRMMGRLALTAGETTAAGEYLAAAAAAFRGGDYLTELANTLPNLAEYACATGDLPTAERYAAEAISIAAPRGLVPAHCAALTARASIRAAQATATPNQDLLYQGRDAADAALRLATRRQLAWHELEAQHAHSALDHAERTDHGWAARADALHARLVPPGLDADPLATVKRLIAAQKATGEASADSEEGKD